MRRSWNGSRLPIGWAVVPALALLLIGAAGAAEEPAANPAPAGLDLDLERVAEVAEAQARQFAGMAEAWYRRTPPADRITWGGLGACALLGLGVMAERSVRLRRGRVLPSRFVGRFRDRLHEGQLDRGKGTDLCEMNPSPAARVALAGLRRWGRPTADVERAVALSRQVESDRLRRNIGTLRRIAALAPLLGLLGGLLSAHRALGQLGEGAAAGAWGPAVANALAPLTAGVAMAILALVAFDGLTGRVEKLANELDRLGAETVDAIALATPPAPAPSPAPMTPSGPMPQRSYSGPHFSNGGPTRAQHSHPHQHQIRIEIPEGMKEG